MFFTAAQNQDEYVSDRLDKDLKASTDASVLLRCVHVEGAISFLVKCGRRVSCNHLKVFPSSIKLRTCSYWIFQKKLFHCISFNPEPFTGVMSYLPTMSKWSQSSRAWCSRWAVWAQHAAHQHLSVINLLVFLNNSTEWLCVCLWVQLPAQITNQNRLLSVFSASWLLQRSRLWWGMTTPAFPHSIYAF